MTLPRPLCARLSPELEEELAVFFDEHGWGPSEGLRVVIEEWVAASAIPDIEFRSGPLGRRAAVRGGPEVWEIVSVAHEAPADHDLYAHFSWLDRRKVLAALEYYERFPEPIDAILARNERLADFGSGSSAGADGASVGGDRAPSGAGS